MFLQRINEASALLYASKEDNVSQSDVAPL